MNGWQRIKTGRWLDVLRGCVILYARRRDAPRSPCYAVAVRIPRELREDICFIKGKSALRRYENTIKAAMVAALESKGAHAFYVRDNEIALTWTVGRIRLRSLADLPDLRRHKEALLRAA